MSNEQMTKAQPMDFFSENVDLWGASEWFNRLATAIRQQDAAVRAGDMMKMETCRNVAASSAMRLVRDYEQQVRTALAAQSAAPVGPILSRVAEAWQITITEPSESYDMQPPMHERYVTYTLSDQERFAVQHHLRIATPPSTQMGREKIARIILQAMSDKAASDTYGVSYARNINTERAKKAAEVILSALDVKPGERSA